MEKLSTRKPGWEARNSLRQPFYIIYAISGLKHLHLAQSGQALDAVEIILTKLREQIKSDSDVLTMYDGNEIPSSPTTASRSPPRTAVKLRRAIDKVQTDIDNLKDIIETESPLRNRLDRVFKSGLMHVELRSQRSASERDR